MIKCPNQSAWNLPPDWSLQLHSQSFNHPLASALKSSYLPRASVEGLKGTWNSQSSIFFSSGLAQMNGGGDFCMFMYSCELY